MPLPKSTAPDAPSRRLRRLGQLAVACGALLGTACSPAPLSSSAAGTALSATPASPSAPADASSVPASPTVARPPAKPTPNPLISVGPLFKHGTSQPHNCTASVLDTPEQDLVLTAAHCVSGTGQGLLFVPGYAHGVGPYGVWQVSAAYVDEAWLSSHDVRRDYAILRVADQYRDGRLVGVQALTGGNRLGLAPVAGQRVSVIAYNQGTGDSPVSCAAPVYDSGGQPSFDCHGFSDGTSGGPWLVVRPGAGAVVRGLIGGLHQGGCFDYTSYSPAFTEAVFQLLSRAEQDQPADSVPSVGSDC